MMNDYAYAKGERDKNFIIRSMKKYVDQPQELDKFLRSLIAPVIQKKELKVLDAACGIGHLSHLLSDLSPQSSFLGVDQTPYLIEQAKDLWCENRRIAFEVGDIYELPAKYPKEFDVSICWKTISWLPYYDRMLEALIGVTKEHVFLSSLFYDGDIDFEIKVREFKKQSGQDGFNAYYNVYSYPRFQEFVHRLGAREVRGHNFEIGIDIPRPPVDQMGTYTVRLDDGKRLQISGAVLMSWKVIRIDL